MKRIRILRRGLALLICCILLCSTLSSCTATKEKTFTRGAFSINLTDAFRDEKISGFFAVFSSASCGVFVIRETFSEVGSETFSLEEYARKVIANNGIDCQLSAEHAMISFEYDRTVEGRKFTYLATVRKGAGAYWLIQFATESHRYEDLRTTMFAYASSVNIA